MVEGDTPLQGAESTRLCLELYRAAVGLHRAASSEHGVFQAFETVLGQTGLFGSVGMLAEDEEHLVLRAVAQPALISDKSRQAPHQLALFYAPGVEMPGWQVNACRQVLTTGRSYYLSDNSGYFSQILPALLRPSRHAILRGYIKRPGIFSPVVIQGQVRGVLSLFGVDLTQADIPAVETFATHLSTALETAQSSVSPPPVVDKSPVSVEEISPSGMIILQDGRICYINTAMETITGYSRRQLLDGRHSQQGLGKEFWDQLWDHTRVLQEGKTATSRCEVKIQTAQGTERWLDVTMGKTSYENRMAFLGTVVDITAYKQVEEEIRRLKEFNEQIVQSMSEGIVLENEEGYITFANAAAAEMLGYAPHELSMKHWTEIVPPDQQEIVRAADQRRLKGISDRYPLGLVRKDGQRITVQVGGRPRFEAGKFAGSLAVFTDITERKQVDEALQRRVDELAVLHALSLDITSLGDTLTLMQKIVERAHQLLHASATRLWLCDRDNNKLHLQAAFPGLLPDEPEATINFGEGQAGGVALSGEPLMAGGGLMTEDDTPGVSRESPLTTTMSVPLLWQGQVNGVLQVVEDTETRRFTAGDLELLTLFASQAAIALENARLFEQAAIERRHAGMLYELARGLATSLDPDDILERATSLTCQVLNGLVGEAFLFDAREERLELRALHGRPDYSCMEVENRFYLQLGVGLTGWVAEHRQPAYLPEVSQDPRWLYVSGLDEDARSAISAPILAGDTLWGVLTVLHRQPGAFNLDHLPLMQAICGEVGLALSNASRYQQIERRLAEITLIQSLTEAFNQRLELQVLLDEVVDQLAKRLDYPQVEIFLVEKDMLVQRAYRGCTPQINVLPLTQGIVGRVARTGQAVLLQDVSQDPDYKDCTGTTVAELAVPISCGKAVVGVINIETVQPGQLGPQDRELVEVLAAQISIALENAVLYERVLRHAEDLERTVAQRTAELTELYSLSETIGYSLSYEETLRQLIIHLRKAVGCDLTMAYLQVEDHSLCMVETLRPLASSALEELRAYWESIAGSLIERPSGGWPAMEVIQAQGYNPHGAAIERLGAWMHSPVQVGEQPIGLLIAGNEATGVFDGEHVRLMDTFANQAANAIERLVAILAAERERLESLVEHLPVGVLLLDSDSRLLVANPLGKAMLALMNGGDTAGMLTHLGPHSIADLIEKRVDIHPVEIVLDGPTRRSFEVQAQPVGEGCQQWVLTLREVTQEHENQQRIQMQDRLATVGQLAAGIAHDFNNILAAILVYADLLVDEPSIPPASRERITIIQQQVERASSLIRQILDFSRRSVMEQSTLDLLPFIKELEKMLKRVIPETIRLELSYQQGAYLVNADPTRLQQVFMNLALNSRDAMPDGGTLRFRLGRHSHRPGESPPIPDLPPGDWIWISVADTGGGIPAEVMPHIFEPFYTTKPVGLGTGLGLAQVYGIVKQHGGYIQVDNQAGEGARFTIYLSALPENTRNELLFDGPTRYDGVGEAVLVVEDDLATREALQDLLSSQNYRVYTAADGLEALQCLENLQGPISLVVSDIVMPNMGGVGLYQALRERSPGIKMLFVTGHPLEGESQALLEGGEVHWLQKPFSVKEFNLAVRNLVHNSEAGF